MLFTLITLRLKYPHAIHTTCLELLGERIKALEEDVYNEA